MCRHNRFIDFLGEQFVANLFGEWRIVLLQKTTFASNSFDDALPFQFRISLGDGVAIDSQFFSEWSNRRKRFAGTQHAGSSGVTNLIDQLQIDWLAGFEID